MIDSEYITVDEWEALSSKWNPGWSGYSWFKDAKDGTPYQAYIVGSDKLISFSPWTGSRISQKITRDEYEEMFGD